MTNEDPRILYLDDVPVGYEPVVASDHDADGLAREFWRLRKRGHSVLLCDNGDGTLGLWEMRGVFWLQG